MSIVTAMRIDRSGREHVQAGMCNAARPAASKRYGASWRPSAGGEGDRSQRHAIGRQRLHELPAPELAARAALDVDGGHAAHEGLRILACLRIGRRHRQQAARQRQASRLGFLNPRRAPLDEPLESLAFDPSYRNLLGAKRPRDGAPAVSTTVQVVNLDVRRKIAELPMAGMPQPGSGIRFAHHGTTVLASQNLQDGVIDVIDMKTWKVVKAIPTPGPGFFIRSHEKTPFAWADSMIDPKSKDSLTLIDKKTLEPVATLRKPGHTLAQTAFTKDGRYALVSVWDMDGALIVFDTETLREVKRLPMRKPVGSYNVWNMITRSKRPSH